MKTELKFGVVCIVLGLVMFFAFKSYIDHLFPTDVAHYTKALAYYTKALPEVKPGDVWGYTLDDPFRESEVRTFKVLDVKKGKDGKTYVKSLWIETNIESSVELSWFVCNKTKHISP